MPKAPGFTFRLPTVQADALREMAKTYSETGSCGVLLREMVGALISGDPRQIGEFNAKLMDRLTRQMALQLETDMKRKARAEVKRRQTKGGRRGKPA